MGTTLAVEEAWVESSQKSSDNEERFYYYTHNFFEILKEQNPGKSLRMRFVPVYDPRGGTVSGDDVFEYNLCFIGTETSAPKGGLLGLLGMHERGINVAVELKEDTSYKVWQPDGSITVHDLSMSDSVEKIADELNGRHEEQYKVEYSSEGRFVPDWVGCIYEY